jgi:hypothetical protein
MQIIEIQTLIDITDTKVNRLKPNLQLEHDQFRNFVTLKQCVEMRSNISFDTSPSVETKDVKELGFGSKYKGKHSIWTFRFSPDRLGAYSDENGELTSLVDDVHEVPVIKNLKESINIERAVFDLKDSQYKNTIIKILQGII